MTSNSRHGLPPRLMAHQPTRFATAQESKPSPSPGIRIKQNDPPRTLSVRHDHKLKALAIKKAQIHVIGSPSLPLQRTPVFMDVEGMPDRSFYYLIGLRYDLHGTPVERSFWADKRD